MGRGHGELFTRKSRGSVFEPARPSSGQLVLARALAPAAAGWRCGGREGAAQLVLGLRGPRPPLAACARAALARGRFSPFSQRSNLISRRLQSSLSQPAERASDRGWAVGDERPEKVTVVARFLPREAGALLFTCNRVVFAKPLDSEVLRPREGGIFPRRLGRVIESTSKERN